MINHRRSHYRVRWAPPQSIKLRGAWVSGISGAVSALGTWEGAYETAYDLTLVGDATVNSNGLSCNGGDYAGMNTPLPLTNHDGEYFTVAFWARTTNNQALKQTIVVNGGDDGSGSFISINNDSTPSGHFRVKFNNNSTWWASSSIANNTWTHIVWTFNSANADILVYKNGVYTGLGQCGTHPLLPTQYFRIGGNGPTYGLIGDVDCVYVWDTTLSQAEITNVYSSDPYKKS